MKARPQQSMRYTIEGQWGCFWKICPTSHCTQTVVAAPPVHAKWKMFSTVEQKYDPFLVFPVVPRHSRRCWQKCPRRPPPRAAQPPRVLRAVRHGPRPRQRHALRPGVRVDEPARRGDWTYSTHTLLNSSDTPCALVSYKTSVESSDAARHNRTCGKSTARPHVRARAVNVR